MLKKIKLLFIVVILGLGSTVNAQNSSSDANSIHTGFYVEGGIGAYTIANKEKYTFNGTATVNGTSFKTFKIKEKQQNPISGHVEGGYTFNNWFALGLSGDFYSIDQEIYIDGTKKDTNKVKYTTALIKATFSKQYAKDKFVYFSLGAGSTTLKDDDDSYTVPAVGVGLGIKSYFSDNFYMKVGLDATLHKYKKSKESISSSAAASGLSVNAQGTEKINSTITTGIQLKFGYQF